MLRELSPLHLDHVDFLPLFNAASPHLLTQTSILYYFWLTTNFSKSFPSEALQIYLPLLILCHSLMYEEPRTGLAETALLRGQMG